MTFDEAYKIARSYGFSYDLRQGNLTIEMVSAQIREQKKFARELHGAGDTYMQKLIAENVMQLNELRRYLREN